MNATTAYLGLGANLGDAPAAIRRAAAQLRAHPDVRALRLSRLHRAKPWGVEDQPDFVNAAAQILTRLEPEALLDVCLELERQAGRRRRIKWGPRELDIDVLLYGDRPLETARLSVPHPHLHERIFVLQPLLELDPGLIHPVSRRPLTDLLAELPRSAGDLTPLE
jgi:2-amino-4-hydroxy-6-hydroxymethyldihydropteridine diphosphokinase